jgi:hypothetical protein
VESKNGPRVKQQPMVFGADEPVDVVVEVRDGAEVQVAGGGSMYEFGSYLLGVEMDEVVEDVEGEFPGVAGLGGVSGVGEAGWLPVATRSGVRAIVSAVCQPGSLADLSRS